jgi:hypothetical protein
MLPSAGGATKKGFKQMRRRWQVGLVYGIIAAVLGMLTTRAATADEPDSYFEKGTFALTLTPGYYVDFESGEKINPYTAGFSYYVAEHVALGVEVSGYVLDAKDGFNDAGAGGANLTLRHHVYERGDFSLFLDVALGMIYADDEFPPGGTRFNFTEQFGVGVTYRLADHWFLIGAARYIHISNAYIHGQDQNPGVNAVGGYLGVMFTF